MSFCAPLSLFLHLSCNFLLFLSLFSPLIIACFLAPALVFFLVISCFLVVPLQPFQFRVRVSAIQWRCALLLERDIATAARLSTMGARLRRLKARHATSIPMRPPSLHTLSFTTFSRLCSRLPLYLPICHSPLVDCPMYHSPVSLSFIISLVLVSFTFIPFLANGTGQGAQVCQDWQARLQR